jgi:hypothetical protein
MSNPNPKRTPHPENLQPVKSKEEAREKGRRGGIASGEAKRQKKLLSQVYLDFFAKEHSVKISRKMVKGDGTVIADAVILEVLRRCNSAAVSMLKEMREGTEGNKLALTDPDGGPFGHIMKMTPKERKEYLKKIQEEEKEGPINNNDSD